MASDSGLRSSETKAAFEGTVRVFDEGVAEFSIALPSRPRLFGEWRSIYDEDGYTFGVSIYSFGYGDKFNVGNAHPTARMRLSSHEIEKAKAAILELFDDEQARSAYSPFTTRTGIFNRALTFQDDWVLSSVNLPMP